MSFHSFVVTISSLFFFSFSLSLFCFPTFLSFLLIFFYHLFYFILFYFILFYFILFYFILFYFILFILFYFILFYFILFYFVLFYFNFFFQFFLLRLSIFFFFLFLLFFFSLFLCFFLCLFPLFLLFPLIWQRHSTLRYPTTHLQQSYERTRLPQSKFLIQTLSPSMLFQWVLPIESTEMTTYYLFVLFRINTKSNL